jgi:hypothetical protein
MFPRVPGLLENHRLIFCSRPVRYAATDHDTWLFHRVTENSLGKINAGDQDSHGYYREMPNQLP